jgi:squalene monooxygenase
MTVALNDVVMLRQLFSELPQGSFGDWEKVREVLAKWHWKRKPMASTINILSVALYDLFGADGVLDLVFSFFVRADD